MKNAARHLLLSAYYHGSLPWRWYCARRAAQCGASPISVIFYHRVADSQPNPWTISSHGFTRHIRWLQRHFDLITLEEAQRRLRSRGNPRPAVAITFDDGYADNCHFALPMLIKRRIPVTYFVTTRHILAGEPFSHDIAYGQALRPNTLQQLRDLAAQGVEIGAHTRSHSDLGLVHNAQALFDEVVAAGEEMQAAVGQMIRYFAFPFGQHANLSADVFHMAYDAGYEAVCSAYGGYNFPGDDPFHLQRFHADPSLLRLKNWLTVDPRWVNTPRFRYEKPDEAAASPDQVPIS